MTLNVHDEDALRKSQAALVKFLDKALAAHDAELLPQKPMSDVVSISREEYAKLWDTVSLFQTAITNCAAVLGIPLAPLMTIADICHIAEQIKERCRNNRWNIREDGETLIVCKSDHEKWEGCREVRYAPEEVLTESISHAYEREMYWHDKYNREVEGLNNEGDAIGGEPPCGLRHIVEHLRKENERLRSLLPPVATDTAAFSSTNAGCTP